MKKLGQRDSNTAEVFFDDVFIPSENLLGQEGQGLKIAFYSLQRSKMMFAASAVGACDRAADLVYDHLENRVHYGKPLLALPTIQTQLAQLHTEVEASWLLTLQAAAKWDTGDFGIREASMAKLFAAHTAVKVMCESVELFGGMGFSSESEIERLYRDCKILEIIEGATFVQQTFIAKELFGERLTRASTSQVTKRAA
jgi:alkylation response protein AidB-like acyl-CoA dehydrogenase